MVYLVSLVFFLISILLIWYLVSSEKGPKEPAKAMWIAFGFGVLATILAPITDILIFGTVDLLDSASLRVKFISSFGTGFIEEIFKFVPLALFIYKKQYFSEHSDGIIYFAIAGLTFGFLENIIYTLGFGVEAGLMRLILVPIFHGASTGIAGYFLAKQKVTGGSVQKTVFGLIGVAVIHGMYNFGLLSGLDFFILISLMLTVLLVLGLFLFYNEAKRKDLLHGLSVEGPNKYCKYCGRKNVKRSLYCEYCGKRL